MAEKRAARKLVQQPVPARRGEAREPVRFPQVGTYVPPKSPDGLVVTFRKGEPVSDTDQPAT